MPGDGIRGKFKKTTMAKILIVGSLTFDVIFQVHGNIKNEIPLVNGVIENLNLMFRAKEKKEYYGGTGGNIAFSLGLLQEHPALFSVAGKDFEADYRKHLEDNGIELKVILKPEEYTATFYGISDIAKQQIGIFQPNAYGRWIDEVKLADTMTEQEIQEIEFACFSPGTGFSTWKLMQEFRAINTKATIIFDPSQELSISFDKNMLTECLQMADIFIGNETEFAQLKELFGLDIAGLTTLGIKSVIQTKGEKGSVIYSNGTETQISAIDPEELVETTGAGDAFRAGLIYGLVKGKTIAEACNIGAYMGARSVGGFGGQLYSIDLQKVN